MSAALPTLGTVAAPASGARILTALTESPGQGAYELAAALGYDGRCVARILQRMRNAGVVVADELDRPRAGRPARIYFAAPEGTAPPSLPRQAESPAEREERRRRERVRQRRRRARSGAYLVAPPAAWQLDTDPGCRAAGPALFFGPEIESPQARAQRVAEAKAVCAGCPARRSCLATALANGERYGVWGGVDLEAERKSRSPKATRPDVAASGRA